MARSGRRRGLTAFSKTIVRSIRGSLGRFLAILGIVALGCGFYAGLQMCGPNMRADADSYYDGTNLYDIRVVSTLGFGKDDVARVASVEGVSAVMPAISCDVMARLGEEQLAVRMSSIDVDKAEGGKKSGANAILSSDGSYLNRVILCDGTWPKGRDECVITADKDVAGLRIGDEIKALYGTSDLDDLLRSRTFKIVGTVSSSSYPYTGSFGSTTLGSGMIGEYVYVSPSAFVEDAPFTEMYLRVEGADAFESGSDEYQEAVDVVRKRVEDGADALARARLEDVRADAQEELDEKTREFEDEKSDVLSELADAKAELDDAAKKISDGEKELADGRAEYDKGVAELAKQRGDAKRQLDDAQKKLDSGAAQIDAKTTELELGRAEYQKGKKTFESSQAKLLKQLGEKSLESAAANLNDQRSQATQGISSLETAKDSAQQIVDGRAQLAAQQAKLAEGRSAFEAGKSQLLSGLSAYGIQASTLADAQAAIEQMIAQMKEASLPKEQIAPVSAALEQTKQLIKTETELAAGESAAAQAKADLDSGEQQLVAGLTSQGIAVSDAASAAGPIDARIAEIQAGVKKIDEGLVGVNELVEAKATLDESAAKIKSGEAQIESGRKDIEAGRKTLATQRAEAERKLADAQAQLDDAKRKLADAEAELADGKAEYADGLAEYEDGKAEADEELAKAQDQIDDAQRDIDELEVPDIYALDRAKSEGAATYDADTHRMDSIADVFPFMFFLVAALVSLTTMTRMVEDDRILIGTYKALGYSTARIASKYLVYAGLAGVAGATLGILAMSQVLPLIVSSSYAIIYAIPLHPLPLPIDLAISLAAGGLGVGVTLLATWGAVVASLREVPATLMLPRAPAAGKRILLERVTPVWRRLSFSWKVTCRNLFRYKRRFAMTVIGISGCTALLLVGFGLHDAIWDIIDCQYGPVVHYDTTVGLDDDAVETDVLDLVEYLEGTGEVTDVIRVQQQNMQAGTSKEGETIRVQVIIPRVSSEIEDAVTFRERVSQAPIAFGDDAVIITEKLSLKYGIGVGDDILLFDQDTIGNITGSGHAMRVTGVAENYVGNLVYVGRDAWKTVDDARPVFSTVLCSTTEDPDVRKRVTDALHEDEDVSTVLFSDESINLYRNMLSVVDLIVVVLIVSAGLLAFIVLYNLTNINIGERVREIASLKVLGFTKGEVYAYIFREIFLLAAIGDALGMVFGTYLATFVITTAEVDYVMFGRTIHPLSYVYAFAITLVFTGIIVLIMRKKLDRVNMVESLKSVE